MHTPTHPRAHPHTGFVHNANIDNQMHILEITYHIACTQTHNIACTQKCTHTHTHTHTHTQTHIHVECISACTEPSYHKFYFVSNFNSYDIVLDLKGMEINATGTLQSNRTKHCPLPSSKDMKKKPRGSYDC